MESVRESEEARSYPTVRLHFNVYGIANPRLDSNSGSMSFNYFLGAFPAPAPAPAHQRNTLAWVQGR